MCNWQKIQQINISDPQHFCILLCAQVLNSAQSMVCAILYSKEQIDSTQNFHVGRRKSVVIVYNAVMFFTHLGHPIFCFFLVIDWHISWVTTKRLYSPQFIVSALVASNEFDTAYETNRTYLMSETDSTSLNNLRNKNLLTRFSSRSDLFS